MYTPSAGSLRACLALCAVLLASTGPVAPQQTPSPVLQAMQAELDRSLDKLKTQPVPPYFLSYEITESRKYVVIGAFGKILNSQDNRVRHLEIDVRVGSYDLDNTREIRGGLPASSRVGPGTFQFVPVDDDPDAIRAILWSHTDRRYKQALELFTRVRTDVGVKVQQEDESADFSREEPQRYSEPVAGLHLDRRAWEEKIRKYTAPFAGHPRIYAAEAVLTATAETRWYVNSEGARIQTSQPVYQLMITAMTKADDGMELPRYESFAGFTEQHLPDDAAVLKAVDGMIRDLEALRTAPVVDPYTGPAILSGRASGVFFHEVFGHRVEGHREKNASSGQTFKRMVSRPVLPKEFSVYFDPAVRRAGDQDLVGSYRYDNEGVKGRRVGVVENGILKTFLMSRSPIQGFPQSNGHGRGQPGLGVASRQSNLIVEVAPSAVKPDLKKLLIEEVRKKGLPFGLYFGDIEGGFTMTGRTVPNAFNVLPLVVYRIYPDGREELVRGVDLIGTPLTTFGKITAADNNVEVFNGLCGAESGRIPVSAASPGILLSQIEVQKKAKSQERPPILPAPMGENR